MLRDRGVNMNSVKAVVAAFNQEKALVGAFSVITNLWMELFEAPEPTPHRRLGPSDHSLFSTLMIIGTLH